MSDASFCDHIRTHTDCHAKAPSFVCTDDLAVLPIATQMAFNQTLDPIAIDVVGLVCANPAGEDHRNVARMAGWLAGMPGHVTGGMVN